MLRRILWEELWDFVLEPTDDDGGILEMDDEPPRSISDAGIKDLLRLQYGIVNVMDVQNLEKSQRNKIIKELCDQGAGFRQLARITGISYGIIQRVVTDQSPLIYENLKNVIDNRAYDGIVTVDGYQLQYSIYRIRKDLYNIGRIHELK